MPTTITDPVLERALVPTCCPECGDWSLTLGYSAGGAPGIADGRHRINEISVTVHLGCDACSATITHWSLAEFLAELDRLRLEQRPTLERCICGQHRDCPDGWHTGEDVPCSCTPDCALDDGPEDEGDEDDELDGDGGGEGLCEQPGGCPADPDGQHHIGCGC